MHTWPYVQRFPEILDKYGDRIRIYSHGEEEWSIFESRDAELTIATLMQEFELKTLREHLTQANTEQFQRRALSSSSSRGIGDK